MSKELNGGYSLKIGGEEWPLLNGYSPSWTEEEKENLIKCFRWIADNLEKC